MNRLIKTALIVFFVFFLFGESNAPSFANEQKAIQIQEKREQAKKQIKKLKLLERIETGKLYNNQRKLEKTENSLSANKIKYENAQNELERLRAELNRQISEYNEYQRAVSKRVVQIYKSKRSGYVEFLMSSGDLNDFLDRIYYENIIMRIDDKKMADARERALNIKKLKQQMERQKEYLASTIKTMDKEQKIIQNAIERNERMIDRLKTDRAAWEKSERELAKQSEQLGKFITKTVKDEPKTTTVKTSGGFLRPVSGPITSPFGSRVHPIFKRTIFHTGVDLGMPMGAKVKASNSGKVIYVGWYGGYGKVVIIDHGKVNGVPVTSLYAHLSSYSVSNGSSVYKGQIIGNVGATGYATGPHLHFEMRENGKPVNPSKYAPI
ncbi:TPA: peptidoglycan DD-metalloendopeptidase family protein [Candidatus Galligastranaerophilus gallistercoris]|nr:peptidoglycan DD-metalloendopeptidase family protein [Candidatus Galligastranaerophilus gallistercoris]